MSTRRGKGGFAALSKEQRWEIASKGGKAVHAKGTGHKWTPEEAREAGRKGGLKTRNQRWAKDRQEIDAMEEQAKEGRQEGRVRDAQE